MADPEYPSVGRNLPAPARPPVPSATSRSACGWSAKALVTTYGKVAFGDKGLTGGVVIATALVAACAALGDALTEDLRERNPDLDGSGVPERDARPG